MLLLFLFILPAALFAGTIEIGKPHRLIGDQVRVRSEPNMKGEVIIELKIGNEVIPLEETEYRERIDGVEAPWYKVSYGKKGSGFVWGNLIAKQYVIRNGLIFLYGSGFNKKEFYTSRFRVAKAGKELARIEIDEGVDFFSHATLSLKDGRGFTGVDNIVTLKFRQEYCAGKGNSVILFWTGEKLLFVHSTSDGADAPVYATETQTFPDEKGGKKDKLYIVRENGDHDNPKAARFERFWLKWNGRELKRIARE
jgi:hypothetical protein